MQNLSNDEVGHWHGEPLVSTFLPLLSSLSLTLSLSLSLSLFFSSVTSISPVWHRDLSKQQGFALERVQASVARWILKAPWTTPKKVFFEQPQWPSLSWRRSIAATCLLHQLLQNPTDPLKDCLFPFSSTVSSYNFRKPRQLILRTTSTSRYLNSFFYHSALLWNFLPSSIQSITKPNHFRQELTSHWREQKYQPVSQLF